MVVGRVLCGEPLPEMGKTFQEVSSSIDRFVSFDGAFAEQKDMADFLACWVLGTYATDAFDTVGYIWPNGERGSGKSQCLKTVMSMAFMGQTVTSSSSFATIRDEAALGATLGFDDCENLRNMDGSKRELLLAGNTKGAQVMVKEPGPREGQWENKYIDAFAPRAFTSIGLPDDTLASRTVMIPLIRSGDIEKTRRKPTNMEDWGSVNPNDLRDGIWLNVARGLSEIHALKKEVNKRSDLSGRDFDIFQAPLTVALWLEECHGQKGLFARMQAVMESYHASKQKNLLPSVEHVVLQAMNDILSEVGISHKTIPTGDIVSQVSGVLNRWDITDESLRNVDRQKVGMLLGRLGFSQGPSHRKARSWLVTLDEIEQKAKLAGVILEVLDKDETEPEKAEWASDWHPSAPASLTQGLPW